VVKAPVNEWYPVGVRVTLINSVTRVRGEAPRRIALE
jgi:hypothetical protein